MNDFLADQLRHRAAAITVPPGDAATTMARGRQRRWRQRALAGASTATAVGVVAAGVMVSTHRGPTRTQVATTGPTEPAPATVTLSWHVVTPTSALGGATTLTASAPLYALSTAPGAAAPNPAPAIYRSTDGLDWTQTSGPSGLYVTDLAASGPELYAVGTGPATSAVGGAVPGVGVAWTPDGGQTWHDGDLPLGTAAISAGTTGDTPGQISVASGAKGTVVVASLEAQLDLPHYLPAGVTASNGWAVTATGVDVLARSTPTCPAGTSVPGGAPSPSGQVDVVPCAPVLGTGFPKAVQKAFSSATGTGPVTPTGLPATPQAIASSARKAAFATVTPEQAYGVTRSYTWAQLGVSAEVERAVLGAPFAFYSAHGTTFTPVTLPAPVEAPGPVTVVADADGFTIVASGGPGPGYVLRSTDGTTWSAVGAPPASASTAAVGELGGQVAMVSQGATGIVLSTLGPGGQWTADQLDSSVLGGSGSSGLVGAAFGPLGVVVVASSPSGPAGTVAFSTDGAHWSAQPIGQLVKNAVGAFNPIVTATSVIVSVATQTTSPAQAAPTVALVGSPS